MNAIFLKLVNMSIIAGWLVTAVALLRLLLKKAPKWIICVLWALVAIRLVCPFSYESVLSLVPSAETIPQDILYASKPEIHNGITYFNSFVNPVISRTFSLEASDSVNTLQTYTFIASAVWIGGLTVMLVYALVSFLYLRHRVRASVRLRDNIWICDEVKAGFILGIVKPQIYLYSGMDEAKIEYVTAHEKAHLKRHDYLWKPLGFVFLAVYWFNPLIWLAYILFCRDIELACDEKVVRDMEKNDKIAYSQVLLDCSSSRKTIVVCPLAFGEVGIKARVKSVLSYKKPTFWILAAAIAACIILGICFLTNPISRSEAQVSSISEDEAPTSSITGEKIPQYYGLNTMKGLELYVWKMSENSYSCGLLSGTNRSKELGELLKLAPATVDEMKGILASYDIPHEDIDIIPFQHPLSSYLWLYETDTGNPTLKEILREEFGLK